MKTVRATLLSDLDTVMQIYDCARKRMRINGNSRQWINGYPDVNLIRQDIANGNSFVIMEDNVVKGVFTFIIGDDPTYAVIDGEWPNSFPYGTIHRIAAADGSKGIADAALSYCTQSNLEIRIDTHSDNKPMLNWIQSRGFKYCGIIYCSDGSPRKAFILST